MTANTHFVSRLKTILGSKARCFDIAELVASTASL